VRQKLVLPGARTEETKEKRKSEKVKKASTKGEIEWRSRESADTRKIHFDASLTCFSLLPENPKNHESCSPHQALVSVKLPLLRSRRIDA
jgi:hypothetical protein